MDAKTLRRACEVAGWFYSEDNGGQGVIRTHANGSLRSKADLASLLVAMVRERGPDALWRYILVLVGEWPDSIPKLARLIAKATNEQRIAAALEVVDDGR